MKPYKWRYASLPLWGRAPQIKLWSIMFSGNINDQPLPRHLVLADGSFYCTVVFKVNISCDWLWWPALLIKLMHQCIINHVTRLHLYQLIMMKLENWKIWVCYSVDYRQRKLKNDTSHHSRAVLQTVQLYTCVTHTTVQCSVQCLFYSQ